MSQSDVVFEAVPFDPKIESVSAQLPGDGMALDPELDQKELDEIAGGGQAWNHNQGIADAETTP